MPGSAHPGSVNPGSMNPGSVAFQYTTIGSKNLLLNNSSEQDFMHSLAQTRNSLGQPSSRYQKYDKIRPDMAGGKTTKGFRSIVNGQFKL